MADKSKKNRQNQPETVMIKYFVSRKGESDCVIELPAHWKLTLAGVNPQAGRNYGDGYALRIYEGEKLRTVLGNVVGFRDMSIPLAVKIEKQAGESRFESDSLGNFEMSESRKTLEAKFIEEDEDDLPF